MPLNEECGLLEWVVNTHALKNILEKGYQRHNKRIWVSPFFRYYPSPLSVRD
jgi:serine/threonine-protein kinase ATR